MGMIQESYYASLDFIDSRPWYQGYSDRFTQPMPTCYNEVSLYTLGLSRKLCIRMGWAMPQGSFRQPWAVVSGRSIAQWDSL
jgi:hypothetical protein